MKLVDILARELKVWPEGSISCVQDKDREVRFHGGVTLGDFFASELADKDDEVYLSDGIPYAGKVTRAEWQAAVDELYPKLAAPEEWNGEGLPPVGTVCEYRVGNGTWYSCTIRYVTTPISDEEVQVIVHCPHLNGDQIGGVGSGIGEINFRPIRTPEQIAAEERSIAVSEIVRAVGWPSGTIGAAEAAERIYDAGYRKQVAP